MDRVVLVTEEIEAGRRFAQAFHQYAPLVAVFWAKESEASERSFYLASNQSSSSTTNPDISEVLRINQTLRSLYLKPMQIEVINGNSPMAQAAIKLNEQFPNPMGHMLGSQLLGDTYIDYGYVYPPVESLTPNFTQPSDERSSTP